MGTTKLIVFDDGSGRFGPLTDFRAVFELRTGAVVTLERIERAMKQPAGGLIVPEELAGLIRERYVDKIVNLLPEKGDDFLLVNGRWSGVALTSEDQTADQILALESNSALIQGDHQLVAVRLGREKAGEMVKDGQFTVSGSVEVRKLPGDVLINRPWDILERLNTTLHADIAATSVPLCDAARANNKTITIFGNHRVHIAPDAEIQPNVVINAEQGPVVVHGGALIGALSVLEGPCYIGPGTVVACQTHIRLVTAIGPVCKVAGEISHSVVQGYSNKAHHGYLGHALMGSWVNLGAATNVSNLKNTYSNVRMQLEAGGEAEDTGQMYQGPVIGDYVRTAICTKLLTGSCISTGCMIASGGFGPKYADRFGWYTDAGRAEYDIEKLILTVKKLMGRRDCEMTEAEEDRIRFLAGQE